MTHSFVIQYTYSNPEYLPKRNESINAYKVLYIKVHSVSDDGRVEDMHSSSPVKTPESQLAAE